MTTPTRFLCVYSLLLSLPVPVPLHAAARQASIAQRPTDVTLVLSSRRGKATYQASQISRMCGEVSPELSMTGERVLLVEFPDDGALEITNVSFSSKTMVGGLTATDTFHVSVGVKPKPGAGSSSYLLDTARPKQTGKATATLTAGTLRLTVVGTNDMGEGIDMTVVCHPAKG